MSEIALAKINSFPPSEPQSDFRTALELARTDPEQQPRDIQAIVPNLIEVELRAANEEIARLQEKNRALAEEIRHLKEGAPISDPKRFFDMLERISMNVLAPILEHEATDHDSRDIARELRVRPDELRHYLLKGEKSYLEAIEELSPFIDAAKIKLLERRKRGAAERNNDHRARLLLEKLELRREIRIAQAIDIIDGDEGVKPSYMVTRRAMRRAVEIEPNNVVLVEGWNDGNGTTLKRK